MPKDITINIPASASHGRQQVQYQVEEEYPIARKPIAYKTVNHRLVNELGYDPLAESVAIARGEAMTRNHPFLPILIENLSHWKKQAAMGKTISNDAFDKLIADATEYLTDSWTPLELRSKHVLELMNYIYPKLKSVDTHVKMEHEVNVAMKPLTESEIQLLADKFSEHF